MQTLAPALKAFMSANGGEIPTNPSDLEPYANTDRQKKELRAIMEKFKDMSDDEKAGMKTAVQEFLAKQPARSN